MTGLSHAELAGSQISELLLAPQPTSPSGPSHVRAQREPRSSPTSATRDSPSPNPAPRQP